MIWRVSLIACHDGSAPDEQYSEGVVIEDRRAGAADLIRYANIRWSATPLPGEVYSIELVGSPSLWVVEPEDEPGFCRPSA